MRETERQKRWVAGSITAYLCLVLILMLSLISGTIASVRNAHARVMTACAMEQGLYSLFAGYDRTLLGQYELFFYNGGDKSGVWKPETMSRKVAETAGEVLSPTASGMGILSGSLSGGQVTEVYLGGYRLATDEEGSAFSRQICEAMKASLGTYGIQQLSQKLRGEQETVKRQEDGQSGYEDEEVLKQYEESKQPEEGTEKTEGEGESGNGTPSEPDQKQPVPEDIVNPIEVIQKVMKMGILGLVLPEGQALPQGETDVSVLASKRELQSGFGMAERGKELSFVDKMLSSEYILWKFPCYTSKEKKEGLQCQVEYVLCEKNSDQDNLAGSRVKNGWLELKAIYWPKMGNRLVPVRNRGIAACAKVHLFCGKTEEEADEEEGEAKQMVWVTENGSVYHTDSSCSHINLSIQVSSPGALAWKRNQDGEKYKECEQCVGNGAVGAEVYYTKYGNRYHNSLSCKGLKRKVKLVALEQTDGLPQCSKCAKKAA